MAKYDKSDKFQRFRDKMPNPTRFSKKAEYDYGWVLFYEDNDRETDWEHKIEPVPYQKAVNKDLYDMQGKQKWVCFNHHVWYEDEQTALGQCPECGEVLAYVYVKQNEVSMQAQGEGESSDSDDDNFQDNSGDSRDGNSDASQEGSSGEGGSESDMPDESRGDGNNEGRDSEKDSSGKYSAGFKSYKEFLKAYKEFLKGLDDETLYNERDYQVEAGSDKKWAACNQEIEDRKKYKSVNKFGDIEYSIRALNEHDFRLECLEYSAKNDEIAFCFHIPATVDAPGMWRKVYVPYEEALAKQSNFSSRQFLAESIISEANMQFMKLKQRGV